MSPDDMANFHEHMAAWCREERGKRVYGVVAAALSEIELMHDEAFQYWCRQANPGDLR